MLLRSLTLILLSLSFYGATLSIVFFTVGAYVMNFITVSQAQELVKRNFSPMMTVFNLANMASSNNTNLNMGQKINKEIYKIRNHIKTDKSLIENEKIRLEKNTQVVIKSLKVFSLICVILVFIALLVWRLLARKSFYFTKVLKEALIITIVVAFMQITYTIFFLKRMYLLDNKKAFRIVFSNTTTQIPYNNNNNEIDR